MMHCLLGIMVRFSNVSGGGDIVYIMITCIYDYESKRYAFSPIQAANYVLAPLIPVVFVIVVSFVLLNMVCCRNIARVLLFASKQSQQ
jgi:hypothetical protein